MPAGAVRLTLAECAQYLSPVRGRNECGECTTGWVTCAFWVQYVVPGAIFVVFRPGSRREPVARPEGVKSMEFRRPPRAWPVINRPLGMSTDHYRFIGPRRSIGR